MISDIRTINGKNMLDTHRTKLQFNKRTYMQFCIPTQDVWTNNDAPRDRQQSI